MAEFDMINDNYNVLRKKYPLALKEQPINNLLFREPDSENVFIQPQVQEQLVDQIQPVQAQAQPQPPVVTPAVPAVAPVTSVPATPTSNVLAGQRPPYIPQTEYEKYWGQKVGTENVGIPLNRFVGLAGKAAYALDPKGFGGILGKQLSDEADVATQEMARREYEGPNKLLQEKLHAAQLKDAEAKAGLLPPWETYKKGRMAAGETDEVKIVRDYNEMLNDVKDKSKTFERIIPNPNFDKSKPVTFDNPRQIKESLIYADGTTKQDPNIPPVPVMDKFTETEIAKFNKEQELKLQERRTRAAEKRAEKSDEPKPQYKIVVGADGKQRWELVKPGDIARPTYTTQQLVKFENVLRNPAAVKIEDLTAAAEGFNEGSNKPYAFLKVTSNREVPGLGWKFDSSDEFKEVKLPKGKNGQQILTSHVRDLADKRGVTFEEALRDVINHYGAK